jgi:hypothetical protein
MSITIPYSLSENQQSPKLFNFLNIQNKCVTPEMSCSRHNSVGIAMCYELQARAVAQAISRWLPTAGALVRVRAACGVCGGQSGIVAGFLRLLRFPLPIIPPISPSP